MNEHGCKNNTPIQAGEVKVRLARGMPRKINRLAHYALSAAAQDQARCVTLQHMTQAVEEWQA